MLTLLFHQNLVDRKCPTRVIRLAEALGGVFGDGVRMNFTKEVLIPPQLNQTIASQEFGQDPDTEAVYYLLRRACDVFDQSIIEGIIDPIRVKVASTMDLSLLTDDERTQVKTLNRLFNTDYDALISVGTTHPQFGLIT